MKQIQLFFANIHQKFADWRVNREIFNGIFPHLQKEADHGYPFSSDEEFCREAHQAHLSAISLFKEIECQARRMPKAYGEAFRYTTYSDLSKQMRTYLQIGRRRVQPEAIDSHSAFATRA
jgi:hypothetical protein